LCWSFVVCCVFLFLFDRCFDCCAGFVFFDCFLVIVDCLLIVLWLFFDCFVCFWDCCVIVRWWFLDYVSIVLIVRWLLADCVWLFSDLFDCVWLCFDWFLLFANRIFIVLSFCCLLFDYFLIVLIVFLIVRWSVFLLGGECCLIALIVWRSFVDCRLVVVSLFFHCVLDISSMWWFRVICFWLCLIAFWSLRVYMFADRAEQLYTRVDTLSCVGCFFDCFSI